MRATKVQTMTTIAAIIKKYRKKYCIASQAKIVELLKSFYGVEIKERMLNYHLADLRKAGLIKSIKRSYRNRDGTLTLNTSATCLTPYGYYELWKMGNEWAKKMYDRLIKKYCPKISDKYNPTAAPLAEELARRRKLGKEMFRNPLYLGAFGLDE